MAASTLDMTTGNPKKLIFRFALPLLLGFLFQQFYNMVDTIIVGKYVGVDALGAVGSTGAISFLILGFCMGVCNGFSIPIAQRFGAKDEKALRKFVANSVWIAIIFAAIMTAIVVIFCRNILEIMNTPESLKDYAYNYIIIIFLGIPVTYLYNLLSGYIRALGDSKTPLIFLALASIINIILDLVFIIVFKLNVTGAGLATVIAQLISGICCLIFIYKKLPILHLSKKEWRFDAGYARILCNMGIPMGLQYSITAIGSIMVQTAVNTLGDIYVAAVTTGSKISMLFCCPFDALGSTMATYGGQNVGAKKMDRVDSGLKSAVIMGLIYSVIAFIVLTLFANRLTDIFVDKSDPIVVSNPDIYNYSRRLLIFYSAFYFPLSLVNIVRFMIQGLGFSKFAILAGVCEMAARTLAALLLVPVIGYTGICLASPLAWIAADIFLIPAYKSVTKKLKKQFNNA